jgi:two-component system sensor histidine kinase BaeS
VEPRIARRAAASALIAGVVADALFDRSPLGVNVPLATAAVLILITWFGPGRRPVDPVDTWLPVLALVASLGPAIRTDSTVVALDLWLAAAAVSAWSFAVSGVAVTRRTTAAVAAFAMEAAAAAAVGLLWLLARAGADGSLAKTTRNLGRLAPIARGAVIAVPVVIGFSILLTSADAVFGRALDEALRLPFDVDEVVGRGTFSIVAAFLIGGPIAIAVGAPKFLVWQPDVAPDAEALAPGAAAGPLRRSGVTEILVVVAAVDALFALFAAVQVVYLFGGTDTLAAIGMNYSDYARQGFFQLVGVVALAGLLLLGAHAVVGRTRAFLVAAVALLVLTGVILASAAVRLGLYQGAYGWTELRFYVAASIGWLAICVVLALALLSANRMRWLPHGLAMGAAAVTLAVSAIGPQAFAMHENLARALDPSLVAAGGHAGLDLRYGMLLGDDAIPDLVAALDVVPEPDRQALVFLLRLRRDELDAEAAAAGPLSWNLARTRAREALARLPAG